MIQIDKQALDHALRNSGRTETGVERRATALDIIGYWAIAQDYRVAAQAYAGWRAKRDSLMEQEGTTDAWLTGSPVEPSAALAEAEAELQRCESNLTAILARIEQIADQVQGG